MRGKLAERMGCDEEDLTLKDGTAIAGNRQRDLADVLAGDILQGTGTIKRGDDPITDSEQIQEVDVHEPPSASLRRFRPIVMTSLVAIVGAPAVV